MAKKAKKASLSFESLPNRNRFNVLGKKRKTNEGRRGKARSAGLEKVFGVTRRAFMRDLLLCGD